MDSEHRHHLQQNDLSQAILKATPWFERYGTQALIALVVVVVLLVGGSIWWSAASNADAAAWSAASLASTVDEFGDVIDKYPGTLPAAWAHLRSGELNLESGVNAMFRDRELGLKDLEAARKHFDAVLSATVAVPDNVRQRGMLGLAKVLEATSDGDTQPAIDAYERLLKQAPNSIYKPGVEQRIAELKSGGAKEFYAWFQQQKPKPTPFPGPRDGQSGPNTEDNPFAFPPAAAPPRGTTIETEPTDAKPSEEAAPTESAPESATDKPAAPPEKPAEQPAPAAASPADSAAPQE